jgi:hypothetical protein
MRDRELTLDNCKHIKEWDYQGHKELNETTSYSQGDWNQTLLTKINNVGALIYQSLSMGIPNTLKLHPSLMSLIETLEYYNKDDNKVGGRFNILLNNEVEPNIIYVYRSDEVKVIENCSEEEVSDYIKSTQGYVKVLNY